MSDALKQMKQIQDFLERRGLQQELKQGWLRDHYLQEAMLAQASKKEQDVTALLGQMNVKKDLAQRLLELKPSYQRLKLVGDSLDGFASARSRYKELTELQNGPMRRLQALQAQWEEQTRKLLVPIAGKATLAASMYESISTQHLTQSAVFEAMTRASVFKTNQSLAAQMLRPQCAFTKFASSTASLMAASKTERESRVLSASLSLAEHQLIRSTDLISEVVGRAKLDESPIEVAEDGPTAFERQQEELLTAGEDGEYEFTVMLRQSPTARANELVHNVMGLIVDCNQASRVAGKGDIFTPSNYMLQTFAELPLLTVTSKDDLGNAIDRIYWTIYEGAGKDKLRFLDDHGGWMQKDDCNAVFDVKLLRNKWLRHDPNHGSDGNQRASYDALKNVLNGLGFANYPNSEDEYLTLYTSLLTKLVDFLESLNKQIGK